MERQLYPSASENVSLTEVDFIFLSEAKMNVLDLLANDNYLIVNRDLVKLLGLRQAVMFGELCSEQNYWNKTAGEDGQWFYSTQENIEGKIGLSPYEQREALKILKEKGLVERQKKGIPCKTYYRVCLEQVVKIFNNCGLNSLTTESEETSEHNSNNKKTNKKINNNKFIPPTVDEIEDFCKERNNGVDAKRVFDYYSSANWKDGRGNPVKNWKQKIIAVWERDTEKKPSVGKVAHEASVYEKDFNPDGSFKW